MAWHIVQKYLEQTADHSTLVGKYWVTFFFVLRLIMVISIADSVFGDEQGAFVCNTLTPGCKNVCYNNFSPISLIRLWALQVWGVSIPVILFIVYTAHKMFKISQAKKIRKKEQEKKLQQKDQAKKLREEARKKAEAERRKRETEEGLPDYTTLEDGVIRSIKPQKEKKKKKKDEEDDKVVATKLSYDTPSRLMIAYVAQVIFRLVVEIVFTVIQFSIYAYQFWVPELYKCGLWPCPNVVDCFVSRPAEKTVMLWVMFGTSVIMMVLGVVELHHLGLQKMWEAWKTRGQDITKEYKLSNDMPSFNGYGGGKYGSKYARGYPQAVGLRVAYARSNLSGDDRSDLDGEVLE